MAGSPEAVDTPAAERITGRPAAELQAIVGEGLLQTLPGPVGPAMLGLRRGTVGVMASRGTLDKHPDGGITRASVLMRLGR